jgi:hypothetical protein
MGINKRGGYMNTIIITVSLLAAFISGFFVAIKSVQLGLRWNVQVAEKKEPELKNPIAEVVDSVQQAKVTKANNYTAQQIEEYSPFYEEV